MPSAAPRELRLFPEAVLVGSDFVECRNVGLSIAAGVITEITDADALRARPGDAQTIDLPNQVVMAGFVNAHQHGRGATQFQLGYPDDVLEVWMPGCRRTGPLDPYAQTLLACLQMIASGVTGTIHANTAYGTGDLAEEMRRTMRAYADSGLRAAVGVGLWDRSGYIYPPSHEEAFLRTLPSDLLHRLQERRRPSFCATPDEAKCLMRSLRAEHETDRVKVAYAPAGPQWVSDALMSAALRDAAELGCIVHMHMLESWVQYLAACELYPHGLLEHFEKLGPVDERLSFGHAVWLSAHDADRAAERGVTFVRNAGSNLRLKCAIAPLAAYRARGVNVAIGTDSFSLAEDEDILKEARLAGRLARDPSWSGPPAPTPAEMLRMLTRAGAAAAGFGRNAGVLAEGAPADLIAIDMIRPRGAWTAPATPLVDLIYYRAGQPDIRMTMVAGEILYRDGRFLRHDYACAAAAAAEDIARAAATTSAEHRADIEALVSHIERHYARFVQEQRTREAPWRPLALDAC